MNTLENLEEHMQNTLRGNFTNMGRDDKNLSRSIQETIYIKVNKPRNLKLEHWKVQSATYVGSSPTELSRIKI